MRKDDVNGGIATVAKNYFRRRTFVQDQKMDELIGMVESIPSIVSAKVNLTVFVVLICVKVVIGCLLCVAGHGVTGFVPFVGIVLTLVC